MHSDKMRVALTSVLAAIFLTGMKLAAGLATGSLGILSEAAHSALDLGAALLTYVAVRISDKPADDDHSYGHGKVENISALLQTGLLILTCFFIIRAAVERLMSGDVQVEVNVWSFVVIIVSIIVDYSRSRALARIAKTYRSQALEADALHFSSDIWSSSVVIIGLISTALGFHQGDSLAAIGVALFVLVISGKLLKETIDALTDSMPKDIEQRIRTALVSLDGIERYRHLRVRQSGSKVFVDMYIDVKRTVPFEMAHHVADAVETRIHEIVPNADVIIHMEPQETDDESIIDKIRMIVVQEGLACHNVRAQRVTNGYFVDFHLECESHQRFDEAHEASSRIESRLMEKIPEIKDVKVHIEDARDRVVQAFDITDQSKPLIAAVRAIAADTQPVLACSDFIVMDIGGHKKMMLNCVVPGDLSLDEVHAITTRLENRIHRNIPEISSIVIHPELARA